VGILKNKEASYVDIEINSLKEEFFEAMDDDFNTAQALGHVFELTRNINKFLDKNKGGKKVVILARDALKEKGSILNLFQKRPEEVVNVGEASLTLKEDEIRKKIEERKEARTLRNWEKADRIRKELEEYGILLEDRPDGTVWKVKK